MSTRRAFLCAAGAMGYAVAHGAGGQLPAPVKRIGVLPEGPGDAPKEFIDALRERGWVEGKTFVFEGRRVNRPEDIPVLVDELVRSNVDLLIVFSTPAAKAAKTATTTIPVLFYVGADPVERGLVTSMSRPGGNLTGFVYGLYDDKLLEVFKDALPHLARVMYPVATLPPSALRFGKSHGIELTGFAMTGAEQLDGFFAAVRRTHPDGVVVPNVSWMNFYTKRVVKGLNELKVPSIGVWEDFAAAGGLLSYGAQSNPDREVAKIDALLRGANPGEMPVELPTRFRLVVNLVTAKALGITIPDKIRMRASEVIRG